MLVADALDVVLAEAVLQHRRALQRLGGHDAGAVVVLQPVAGGDGAGRPGGAGERRQAQVAPAGGPHRLEDMPQRAAGDLVVAEVVAELAELVEDEVARVLRQQVAGVVDLLDVALRADGADDVLRRVLAPAVQPVEALLAHAGGEDGHTPRRHDAGDGDAAAGVVARARPDGPVAGGVELAGDDPRGEAGVGRQHLVGGDHREPVAEHDDDRALDAGERRRQHHVLRHVHTVAGQVVVPVDPPQVAGVGSLRVGVADAGRVDAAGVGQLGERRQGDAPLAEAGDAVGQRGLVHHPVGQAELVLQRVGDRVVARVDGAGRRGSHG